MDINQINKILKKQYNCLAINIFKYNNIKFIKGVELLEQGISYKYFKINNNEIEKIEDPQILSYLKEQKEANTDISYR